MKGQHNKLISAETEVWHIPVLTHSGSWTQSLTVPLDTLWLCWICRWLWLKFCLLFLLFDSGSELHLIYSENPVFSRSVVLLLVLFLVLLQEWDKNRLNLTLGREGGGVHGADHDHIFLISVMFVCSCCHQTETETNLVLDGFWT